MALPQAMVDWQFWIDRGGTFDEAAGDSR